MHPDNFQYVPKPGNGYVYHLRVNGFDYVGISTTPFSRRWQRHKAPDSGCTKLVRELNNLRATDKWNLISVQIVKQTSNQKLDRAQKYYIKKFASYNTKTGLNSTPGGREVTPYTMHKKRYKRKTKTTGYTWQDLGLA